MGDVALDRGWLPVLVFLVTPVALTASLRWRSGAWKRQLAIGLPVAIGLGLVIMAANEHFNLVPYAFPKVFYFWAAVVIFAITIAAVGWPRRGNAGRAVSLVAVLLTVVLLGVVVNGHYHYYPTVANLFGKTAENDVDLAAIDGIRASVAKSGQLPAKGFAVPVDVPGTVSGFDGRRTTVYLPPAYFSDPPPALPVLIMLAGVPGTTNDWLVGGKIEQTANAFADQNGGRTPILVMADYDGQGTNDTQCVDGQRGRAETYITVDVVDFVRSTFHTATSKEETGIAGFSAGGFCALMLPLRHPDVFTVGGVYSSFADPHLDPPQLALPDVFGGDQAAFDAHDPAKLLDDRRYDGLSMWFEAGTEDPDPLEPTRSVSVQTVRAGIDTCLVVRPGGHEFEFWAQAFRNSLPWLSAKLGLTPMPASVGDARCTAP